MTHYPHLGPLTPEQKAARPTCGTPSGAASTCTRDGPHSTSSAGRIASRDAGTTREAQALVDYPEDLRPSDPSSSTAASGAMTLLPLWGQPPGTRHRATARRHQQYRGACRHQRRWAVPIIAADTAPTAAGFREDGPGVFALSPLARAARGKFAADDESHTR